VKGATAKGEQEVKGAARAAVFSGVAGVMAMIHYRGAVKCQTLTTMMTTTTLRKVETLSRHEVVVAAAATMVLRCAELAARVVVVAVAVATVAGIAAAAVVVVVVVTTAAETRVRIALLCQLSRTTSTSLHLLLFPRPATAAGAEMGLTYGTRWRRRGERYRRNGPTWSPCPHPPQADLATAVETSTPLQSRPLPPRAATSMRLSMQARRLRRRRGNPPGLKKLYDRPFCEKNIRPVTGRRPGSKFLIVIGSYPASLACRKPLAAVFNCGSSWGAR
jgi:hypothetical protein